jgi:hypothetical protein
MTREELVDLGRVWGQHAIFESAADLGAPCAPDPGPNPDPELYGEDEEDPSWGPKPGPRFAPRIVVLGDPLLIPIEDLPRYYPLTADGIARWRADSEARAADEAEAERAGLEANSIAPLDPEWGAERKKHYLREIARRADDLTACLPENLPHSAPLGARPIGQ